MDELPGCWGIFGVTCATCALLCTLGGNFWCGFAKQDVTLTHEGTGLSFDRQVTSGIWNFEDYQSYISSDGSQVWITTFRYCVGYGDMVTMDSLWKAAMAFTILAAVIGGIVACASCGVVCVSPSQGAVGILAAGCLFTTLLQGLVFLYFPSDGCQSGPDNISRGNTTVTAEWGACEPSSAASLAIAATCLWFVAGLSLGWSAKAGEANKA